MTISVAAEPGGGLRDLLVATFRRVMRLYFRGIERVGAVPGPDVAGRVFVANHTNALIDPILIITGAACAISPIAKSTLWRVPGLRWLLDRAGAVPIVRRVDAPDKAASSNADAFGQIAQHLAGGGNILIFPEGTSHSEPQLAPLRTGAARMLVAAEAARLGDGNRAPLTFQAVGLEFDDRTDFRSRCLVLWGPVRQLGDVPGSATPGGDVDEARIQAITDQMAADLRDLLIEGETHDERRRIARVAELLAHDAGDLSLGAWSDAGRQVELANRALRAVDAELIARIAEQVDAYYAELDRLGLTDAVLAGPGRPGITQDAVDAPPAWQKLALAPLAAAGFALYAAPYFLPRWFARRTDADAVSTVKLGAALVVYPVWAAGLVIGALIFLPPPWSWLATAVILTSPFAALRWLDAWYERVPTPSELDRARLETLRRAACASIDEARDKLPA